MQALCSASLCMCVWMVVQLQSAREEAELIIKNTFWHHRDSKLETECCRRSLVFLNHHQRCVKGHKIIGCQVRREPEGSTERYTRWMNGLTQSQLLTQVFTSHGPTVIMPSWYCARDWFDQIGRFNEGGKGVPEDLLLFYESLCKGGGVSHVDEGLLMYRYHSQAATHSVLEPASDSRISCADNVITLEPDCSPLSRDTIWYHRVTFLEERDVAFCDVDENKINKRLLHARGVKVLESTHDSLQIGLRNAGQQTNTKRTARLESLFLLDMTGGGLEECPCSLNLKEGQEYFNFN
ncbi:UDP-GlcNAc:betaGal beta-1,3-N-acetylglucosaminyltransferase-like protein 1 [Acipenser ruthenus]|uniref:UDP-GlcNAc:betaGal beta-1,3-N-acetylglucosaminyltransferase-like protein 1 n=1 Tax=Acipenser ruthenus TaxID=7906 RepID=A0A444UQK6_ACIRT|nr:UDP-GlcNAc:betaGal beta-1,3-N-acetylglucosaminyltransferase-like protein 1 [Acipenser ruthenus]